MDPLQPLRLVKHGVFVASKRARWLGDDVRVWVNDTRGRMREHLGPGYVYDEGRYARTFLARPEPPHEDAAACPRRLYAIWFGAAMPLKRQRSLDDLRRRNPHTPVTLVTEETLADFLLPDHPLHPAYPTMSPVHQSDYIRCYIMHFHGGGYADLKPQRASWDRAFERMAQHPSLLVSGYREITTNYVSEQPRNLGQDLRRYFRFVLGPSAFIMRPRSVFTASWYRELQRRMDYCAPAFTDAPINDPYRLPASYPLWWGELMGDITHGLSLKYQSHIHFDDDLRPVLKDYR